jgi:hypothetical protein
MPAHDPKDPWNRLVDAAKKSGATADDDPPSEPAPSTFVAGVIALRGGLWKFARTILWRRWSLAAALLAIVLYLLFSIVMKSNPPAPTPEPAPSLPLPPEP